MIIVNGTPFDIHLLDNEYSENSIEKQLLKSISVVSEKYRYDNLNMLKFELNLRKEIINSAIALNNSDFSFSGFKESKCNPLYWHKTANGGFRLKDTANPSNAINDIFTNGDKYTTECATAIVIVYYKALINVFGTNIFNKQFPSIFLLGWNSYPIRQYIIPMDNVVQLLLGDGTYFENPDFDPKTPEWRGENVIVLPDSMYYGHGIGIGTANDIIRVLNKFRKNGSTKSAYLTKTKNNLDIKEIYPMYSSSTAHVQGTLVWKSFPSSIISV